MKKYDFLKNFTLRDIIARRDVCQPAVEDIIKTGWPLDSLWSDNVIPSEVRKLDRTFGDTNGISWLLLHGYLKETSDPFADGPVEIVLKAENFAQLRDIWNRLNAPCTSSQGDCSAYVQSEPETYINSFDAWKATDDLLSKYHAYKFYKK